jgi:hypothetical protein
VTLVLSLVAEAEQTDKVKTDLTDAKELALPRHEVASTGLDIGGVAAGVIGSINILLIKCYFCKVRKMGILFR